jgi:hypothetical protein
MTAKELLRERIDEMTEEEAADLLNSLALEDDPDTLSEADIAVVLEGRAAIERGEVVSSAEIRAKYGQ